MNINFIPDFLEGLIMVISTISLITYGIFPSIIAIPFFSLLVILKPKYESIIIASATFSLIISTGFYVLSFQVDLDEFWLSGMALFIASIGFSLYISLFISYLLTKFKSK